MKKRNDLSRRVERGNGMKNRVRIFISGALFATAGLIWWLRPESHQAENKSQFLGSSEQQGMLGVALKEADNAIFIKAVVPGMPASRADIQVGDQVVSIEGKLMHSASQMTAEVNQHLPRTELNLVLRRGGKDLSVRSMLGSRQEYEEMMHTELPGKILPPQEVVDLADGAIVELSADLKPVTLITFWATWCPGCRASIPKLNELTAKYGPKGFEVRALTSEDINEVRGFVADQKIQYPVYLTDETKLRVEYWVPAIPHYILVGPDKKVVASGDSSQLADMVAAIPKLLLASPKDPAGAALK